MRWSHSTALSFTQCPRKWYFGSVLANGRALDPIRKEAYLLKQLCNIHAWRGKIVDKVISDFIIPKLNNYQMINLDQILNYSNHLIDIQLNFGKKQEYKNGKTKTAYSEEYCAFFELEYSDELNENSIEEAKNEIQQSLTNFHDSEFLTDIIEEKPYMIAQRSLQFSFAGVTVTSTPDLIVFFKDKNPLIVDWKVQAPSYKDHWIQLGTYAWALSKVSPHRDFPEKDSALIKDPTQISLLEFQLLRNQAKEYVVTNEDILDIEDHFFNSSTQLKNLTYGKSKMKDLDLKLFPTAKSADTCMNCQYKKMCWEETNVNVN